MTGVKFDSISKSFGAVEVLKNIDLEIEPGELFFLLGPSGCGKTTLLRIIAGFTEATSGSVYLDHKDMTFVPPNKRNTGMVFQNYALWPHMTVGENVGFGLDIRGVSNKEKALKIGKALDLVHLPNYQNRYPHQLSGGQQQRVALARALVIEPDVILLDEPLSNLDAGLRIEMRKEINRIHKELGLTMIYVTHDQKESLSLATRMAVMNKGLLAQVDRPEVVYQNPNSVFVASFVGETNFIKGKVVSKTAELIEVDSLSGKVVCPIARCSQNFVVNEDVVISVRPEGLEFVAEATTGTNVWGAEVVETTYLGEVVQSVCKSGQESLRITSLNPALGLAREGSKGKLLIKPEHVMILPPEQD